LTEDRDKRAELSNIQRFRVINALKMAGHEFADEYFGDYEVGQTNEKLRRPQIFMAIKFAYENGFGLAVSNLSRIGRTSSIIRLIMEKLKIPVFVSNLRRQITLEEALQINDQNRRLLISAQARRDSRAGIIASPNTSEIGTSSKSIKWRRRRTSRRHRGSVYTFWTSDLGSEASAIGFDVLNST
jgi:hypothetical protein